MKQEEQQAEMLLGAAIEQRIAQANAWAKEADAALNRALQIQVVLGYELVSIKNSLPHGAWGKLFGEANLNYGSNFNFSQSMAARYMKLYKNYVERAGQMELGEALQIALGLETAGELPALSQDSAGESPRTLADLLNTITPGVENMTQALFSFMKDDEAPEADKPKGKPLPHMRNAQQKETRPEGAIIPVRQSSLVNRQSENYRDLYAAEWPGVLAVVETYIIDRAPRLYQHDRDQYAAQLRELAAAMAAAKGNIIRE